MSNKNKKLLVSIICFIGVTLLMFISYNVFKNLNNQLTEELLLISMEDALLGKNSEIVNKTRLYYNLGIASKYIGCCTLVVTVILSCVAAYKYFKTN